MIYEALAFFSSMMALLISFFFESRGTLLGRRGGSEVQLTVKRFRGRGSGEAGPLFRIVKVSKILPCFPLVNNRLHIYAKLVQVFLFCLEVIFFDEEIMPRRIFKFDEDSLNSSESSLPSSCSTTSSSSEASDFPSTYPSSTAPSEALSERMVRSIYNDHPGLNPRDERVVELQCGIRETIEELIAANCPDVEPDYAALVAAEKVHGDTGSVPFLEEIFDDLQKKGVESEHYKFAFEGSSPLDQFSINPLIPMDIGDFYFSFTNSSLSMLLTLGLVLLILYFVTKK